MTINNIKAINLSARKKFKAFSIIEAFITLMIVGLALGASAPLITTQVKNSQLNSVQTLQMIKRLEQLESKSTDIPEGAVMYFDKASCPDGWALLTNTYPAAANAFIRNISGTSRSLGSPEQNAAPNITGYVGPVTVGLLGGDTPWKDGALSYDSTTTTGGSGGSSLQRYHSIMLDASQSSDVYGRGATEVRPDNIALLACRKCPASGCP